jgi:hypothetical protein
LRKSYYIVDVPYATSSFFQLSRWSTLYCNYLVSAKAFTVAVTGTRKQIIPPPPQTCGRAVPRRSGQARFESRMLFSAVAPFQFNFNPQFVSVQTSKDDRVSRCALQVRDATPSPRVFFFRKPWALFFQKRLTTSRLSNEARHLFTLCRTHLGKVPV